LANNPGRVLWGSLEVLDSASVGMPMMVV
jgi:hypothetical protein